MVTEDNLKTRPALTDVTNRPRKRPFSSISDAGDDPKGVENLVKKKCELQFGAADTHNKEKGKTPCLNLPFCTNVEDGPSNNIREEDSNLLRQNSLAFGDNNQERIACGFSQRKNHCIQSSDDVVDKLGSAVGLPTISASHDSRFLGLERCAALKGDSDANSALGAGDILKNCTCSFCSKAAYILSELHYQDVKGRLSVLKKSQKEASMMVQKFSGVKETVLSDQQNSSEPSKLELSLMDQWKSLFVHMDNIFAQECSHLESNFETLKNLRDSCKTDLELSDNSHFDNH